MPATKTQLFIFLLLLFWGNGFNIYHFNLNEIRDRRNSTFDA